MPPCAIRENSTKSKIEVLVEDVVEELTAAHKRVNSFESSDFYTLLFFLATPKILRKNVAAPGN